MTKKFLLALTAVAVLAGCGAPAAADPEPPTADQLACRAVLANAEDVKTILNARYDADDPELKDALTGLARSLGTPDWDAGVGAVLARCLELDPRG